MSAIEATSAATASRMTSDAGSAEASPPVRGRYSAKRRETSNRLPAGLRPDETLHVRDAAVGERVLAAAAARVEELLRALHDAHGVREALGRRHADETEAGVQVLDPELLLAAVLAEEVREDQDHLLQRAAALAALRAAVEVLEARPARVAAGRRGRRRARRRRGLVGDARELALERRLQVVDLRVEEVLAALELHLESLAPELEPGALRRGGRRRAAHLVLPLLSALQMASFRCRPGRAPRRRPASRPRARCRPPRRATVRPACRAGACCARCPSC